MLNFILYSLLYLHTFLHRKSISVSQKKHTNNKSSPSSPTPTPLNLDPTKREQRKDDNENRLSNNKDPYK